MEKEENYKVKNRNVFITGASGYIGSMVIDSLLKKDDIGTIITLDKEELKEKIKNNPKIKFIKSNTSKDSWRREIRSYEPEIVIHLAWQIRELPGERKKQWKWNIEGSLNVFDFAFSLPSVKKLIYTSSAACYGAFKKNSLEYKFKESDPLREKEYLYAYEKKVVEEKLNELCKKESEIGRKLDVYVLRLASVTGPLGRSFKEKFSLMSAFSKKLPKDFIYKIISLMVTFIPSTKKFCRQFVHEDDVTRAILKTSYKTNYKGGVYKIFNIAPPGKVVLSKDLAEILGRKRIKISPFTVRFLFFLMHKLTFGKITTSKGGWRFYSYPIVMDGSKITHELDFKYKYTPREALEKNEGNYANLK